MDIAKKAFEIVEATLDISRKVEEIETDEKTDKIPPKSKILEAVTDALCKYNGPVNIGHSFTTEEDHVIMHFDNPYFNINNDDSDMCINYILRIYNEEK